jgi:hypothetical protein
MFSSMLLFHGNDYRNEWMAMLLPSQLRLNSPLRAPSAHLELLGLNCAGELQGNATATHPDKTIYWTACGRNSSLACPF